MDTPVQTGAASPTPPLRPPAAGARWVLLRVARSWRPARFPRMLAGDASGFFIQASQMLGRTPGERCGEMFDLIALAESLGFDVAWLATPTWSSAT